MKFAKKTVITGLEMSDFEKGIIHDMFTAVCLADGHSDHREAEDMLFRQINEYISQAYETGLDNRGIEVDVEEE